MGKAEVILNAVENGASDDDLLVLEQTDEGQFFDEEVPGCTDPTATNYNPEATEDDDSCVYPRETEEKNIIFKADELEEIEVKPTPEEYFTIEPQFFGKQTKSGYKRTKSEEDAVRDLNPQLSGLGM